MISVLVRERKNLDLIGNPKFILEGSLTAKKVVSGYISELIGNASMGVSFSAMGIGFSLKKGFSSSEAGSSGVGTGEY